MPKMKSHRGLAKRVKKTGSGKLKRSHAYTSHRFFGLSLFFCCHFVIFGTVHLTVSMERLRNNVVT